MTGQMFVEGCRMPGAENGELLPTGGDRVFFSDQLDLQLTGKLTSSVRQWICGQSLSKGGHLRTTHYQGFDFHFKDREYPVE